MLVAFAPHERKEKETINIVALGACAAGAIFLLEWAFGGLKSVVNRVAICNSRSKVLTL